MTTAAMLIQEDFRITSATLQLPGHFQHPFLIRNLLYLLADLLPGDFEIACQHASNREEKHLLTGTEFAAVGGMQLVEIVIQHGNHVRCQLVVYTVAYLAQILDPSPVFR